MQIIDLQFCWKLGYLIAINVNTKYISLLNDNRWVEMIFQKELLNQLFHPYGY